MKRVVTFGELMLRLSPSHCKRLLQNDVLYATFGGAEANVAVSLSNFGIAADYVSKFPKNPIGDAAISELKKFGVGTKNIIRGGERMGIYFLEKGASQRASVCTYDRKYSAISAAEKEEFDWEHIFSEAEWFHFTGITPALGENLSEICLEACKVAKNKGIRISCDLNYRSKLWSREQAFETMSKLAEYIDLCIANETDASDVFGIEAPNQSDLGFNKYEYIAQELKRKFQYNAVAISQRESITADDNLWSALLYKDGQFYHSQKYSLHIVDRVGGGDSFAAGLIYGILDEKENQEVLDFAVAASALKHSIEGDFNRVSVAEVEKLMNGNGSGRIQR